MSATRLIPSLGVSDLERSVEFYRTYFGFEIADSYDDDGRIGWCWLRTQGADLMLQQLSGDQQIRLNPAIGQSWVVYMRVDDLDALHARLRRGGFPASDIAETAYDTREFFVSDPDGYDLWVCASLGDEDETA